MGTADHAGGKVGGELISGGGARETARPPLAVPFLGALPGFGLLKEHPRASQVAPPNNQIAEDGPLADAAIAHKFSSMLGVPEPMLLEALPGLNRCFAKRLPSASAVLATEAAGRP